MAPLEVVLGERVRAGVTTTADGNLSLTVGDAASAPAHRAAVDAWLGAPVRWLRQVHGAVVHVVEEPADGTVVAVDAPEADVAVSTSSSVAVGVLVADCVPVVLADPVGRVVAAVHAGRRGVLGGAVDAAVDALVDAGGDPARAVAAVGPAVCGRCYEVPEAMRDEAEALVPGIASTTSWGTPALDLPGAVGRQLAARGLRLVDGAGACTLEDDRWFSHRAAGGPADGGPRRPEGRFAAVVRLLP